MLFLSSVSALEANNSIDTVTGYNSEVSYDAVELNGTFPDLMNTVTNDKKDTLPLKSNELVDSPFVKLQNITEEQNYSIEKIDNAMNKIQNGSRLKTFVIGNSLGVLQFQLVQIRNQIYSLNTLRAEASDEIIKTKIDSQVNYLKEKKVRVEDIILEQKNKFSLFGWFVSSL